MQQQLHEGEFPGRRMLFLPGGQWQVPIIRTAQRMGFHVICADGTENPPGFRVADESIRVPLQDIDALIRIGRTHHVDTVMTEQTDFAVPIVARVAHGLGLRGIPIEVADAATHKGLMRTRVAATSVRQPGFKVCTSKSDVLAAIASLGCPLFYKPVDGQSSRGVGVLKTADATTVEQAVSRALGTSRTGAAIFEQMVSGTECTLEGFVLDGQPFLLAISEKSHYADLPGVARCLTYPGEFNADVRARLVEANEAVVRAIGIPFGITHAEFIVDEDGTPWFIEIAARGGGTRITSHIVPALCGFNPVTALMKILMHHDVRVTTAFQRAAQLRFLQLSSGRRIRCFRNLDELRARRGVLELTFNQRPGDEVPSVEDDRTRHGFVITVADSRQDAIAIAENIERSLDIDYESTITH